jgi:hypothetical protein
MNRPTTKGERLRNRALRIKAMGKYMATVMKMPDATPRAVAIKAKHPKCDCWMCSKKYHRDEYRSVFDLRAEAKLKEGVAHGE